MRFFTVLTLLWCNLPAFCQSKLNGTVFDKSKLNFVEHVRVVSTGGMIAFTDSMGRYSIVVKNTDSVYFIYNNKPTQKFPVNTITDPRKFDISLHVTVQSKYSLLKEVLVYSKSHKQDSIENRETYAHVFNYQKPGIVTGVGPGGTVGADANEIINIFRFKRNKRLKAFQQRLEKEEQEKYIDYRFSKIFVGRVTGLSSPALDSFLLWYRPSYEFAAYSSEIEFNQYILDACYQFKRLLMPADAKKED